MTTTGQLEKEASVIFGSTSATINQVSDKRCWKERGKGNDFRASLSAKKINLCSSSSEKSAKMDEHFAQVVVETGVVGAKSK